MAHQPWELPLKLLANLATELLRHSVHADEAAVHVDELGNQLLRYSIIYSDAIFVPRQSLVVYSIPTGSV